MTDVSKPEVSQSPGERKLTSWVYFIRAGEDGPIKIGYTAGSPHVRMRSLQTGNHERLRLLGAVPGMPEDEAALHERFADLRCEGEWFRPETRLVAFVEGTLWGRQDTLSLREAPVRTAEWTGDVSLRAAANVVFLLETYLAVVATKWILSVTTSDPVERIVDAVQRLVWTDQRLHSFVTDPVELVVQTVFGERSSDVERVGQALLSHLNRIGVDAGVGDYAFGDIPF